MGVVIDDDHLRRRLDETRAAVASLESQLATIVRIAEVVCRSLAAGGTVYTCGNGGSAAEALHLSEELIGCYRDRTRNAQRAVCLSADPTALTCIANDFGFEHVFARQCQALLRAGDVLVVLSTSGNSENVIRALQAARKRGVATVGLLGEDGGACLPLCDHAVRVPGSDSAPIQEGHLVVVHLLCEAVEGWATNA